MLLAKRHVTNLVRRLYNPISTTNLFNHNLAEPSIQINENPKIINSDLNEEISSKILYSTIFDNQKLKLGYSRKIIVQNIIKKKEYKKLLERVNEKPFPTALKYLEIEKEKVEVNSNENTEKYLIDLTPAPYKAKDFPKFWLSEYEYFGGDEDVESSKYGTNDPNIPPSTIPCGGCGAHLHCADPGVPGYIPCEIFEGRTQKELKTIICQRCHFLEYHNIALDVVVEPKDYIETLSIIKDKYALAVLIVDLLDFPCSIWPEISEIVGNKRPVIIVGNKVDLLPKDSKDHLDHIKNQLTQTALDFGLNKLNLKKTCLISAKTGYGVEELITQLHKIWGREGDVYLIGCANVGKSSLFNALLRSDYCKVEASDLIKKATTCPWPGTTLKMLKFPILRPSDIRVYERFQRLQSQKIQRQAEENLRKNQLKKTGKIEDATLTGHIGMTFKSPLETTDVFSTSKGTNPILTLDENSKMYIKSKWCYDTPGVINSEQIHNLLTTEELILMNPTEMITPRAYRISKEMTVFLAGIGRLDFISGDLDYIKFYVFASKKLPILITRTSDADFIYKNLLGSKYLGIPLGDKDRLNKWPKLESSEIIVQGSIDQVQSYDILFSSSGWISLQLFNSYKCKFLAWSPEKRGIFVRKPALVRNPDKLCGTKIRKSLSYKTAKPFVLFD